MLTDRPAFHWALLLRLLKKDEKKLVAIAALLVIGRLDKDFDARWVILKLYLYGD